jgi:mono/diheme cytochrome c family protein
MSPTFQRLLFAAVMLGGAAVVIGSRQPAAAAARPAVRLRAAMPSPEIPRTAMVQQGTNKYGEVCQACHQATGLGMPTVFPPLAGSEWLNGRAEIPIAIVLKGLQGEITVKGAKFNGAMLAWESVLNDADLAETLTYARSQWGNKGTPVTAAQVKAARTKFAARTTPWTPAELRALK